MKTALIDLDGMCYRAAFATQKTTRWLTVEGEDEARASFSSAKEMNEWLEEAGLTKDDVSVETSVEAEPEHHAKYVLKHMIKEALDRSGCHRDELYLTGKDNFRELLYDQYKANRKDVVKPVNLAALRKYAEDVLKATVVNGMEADDALAIRATALEEVGEDYCIITQDKDLWTVVGEHYDFVKQETSFVDPWEASFNFYCQLLTGDTADNIPGLFRVGKVAAAAMLEDCLSDRSMYDVCLAAYTERGIDEDIMIRNARLLHMLRHEKDLWNPPR